VARMRSDKYDVSFSCHQPIKWIEQIDPNRSFTDHRSTGKRKVRVTFTTPRQVNFPIRQFLENFKNVGFRCCHARFNWFSVSY
jgi:hypothetical protein